MFIRAKHPNLRLLCKSQPKHPGHWQPTPNHSKAVEGGLSKNHLLYTHVNNKQVFKVSSSAGVIRHMSIEVSGATLIYVSEGYGLLNFLRYPSDLQTTERGYMRTHLLNAISEDISKHIHLYTWRRRKNDSLRIVSWLSTRQIIIMKGVEITDKKVFSFFSRLCLIWEGIAFAYKKYFNKKKKREKGEI